MGEELHIGRYAVQVKDLEEGVTPNYEFVRATVSLESDGRQRGVYFPERRYYTASEQPSTEVQIHSTFLEDLYFVYAASGPGGGAMIQVYQNPLVRWVWIGGIVMVVGGLICLVPRRRGSS